MAPQQNCDIKLNADTECQDDSNSVMEGAQSVNTIMAIGGVIGPGYFMGMGTGLSTAGPAGLLICFAVVGCLLWLVMQSLGELASFLAVSGSFTHYSARFIDPAWGFVLSWNYFLLWTGIIMAEYTSAIFMSFALLGVWAFGEAEFWLALTKILCIAAFFLCAILISSGVIGNRKIGVFQIFVFAALQYSGTEMIGLTAGESRNPSKDIPTAVRSIIWRILIIFLWGDLLPYHHPASPFVIAFVRAGAAAGANAINAIILVSIFSAVNSALYVGSRTLYGLAKEGAAPRVFLRTLPNGIPIVALVTFHLFGFLSLLNLSSDAGKVYTWVTTMTGVATFITCSSICLCYIRMRSAMRLQSTPSSILPYQAAFWPYGAYMGFGISVFFIFFQGWTAFAPWDVQSFFMNYIIVLVIVLLFVGWKVWHWTEWVRLDTADLVSGRRTWLM
ncbi:amino acid permease-domain-containing protein [Aspergillus pseudoustus]|uniref:Amino acid permease-domain-containing protein n=1 Tax=Aspergillus pseudoustus TaxID=1810923 RepID=A0ABR4JTJ3_9EURO